MHGKYRDRYEVGRMIVEEEQNGEQRAEYGKAILKELSKRLTESLGKGFSVENLKLMRRFYVEYSKDRIGQKVSIQFENSPATREGRKFFLSFSHYVFLMRIPNIDERHFYEIEAVHNGWGIKELERQYDKVKLEDENPTIGILLCKNKNDAVVEMTLPEDNNQIFASKYLTVLPSKEELKKLVESEE